MALWFNSKATAADWVLECKWKCCNNVVCWGFKSPQNHHWRQKYDRRVWRIRWINYFLYRRSGLLHAIDLMLTKCWGSRIIREVGAEKNFFCYSLIVIAPVEIFIETRSFGSFVKQDLPNLKSFKVQNLKCRLMTVTIKRGFEKDRWS